MAGGIGAGISLVQPLWVEAVTQPSLFRPLEALGNKYVAVHYRYHGQWIGDEEAYARMAWDGANLEPDAAQMPEQVDFAIPGERYQEVVLRESAMLIGAAFVGTVLLLVTVQRRRPG
jgi:hypothetical protein